MQRSTAKRVSMLFGACWHNVFCTKHYLAEAALNSMSDLTAAVVHNGEPSESFRFGETRLPVRPGLPSA
jgi:hypothetical protein